MDEHRLRASEVAQGIFDGSIDVVEGSRTLARLRHQVGMSDDEDFLLFTAIGSEADAWPEASIRGRFSSGYLVKVDKDRQLYLDEISSQVRAACQGVLTKMSG